MCLNGDHASPWVLPKHHFHSTQACGESAPSTAICVTLHLGCQRTSLLESTPWPTLGPAGLLNPQRSRQGESAEDRQFVLASVGSQNRGRASFTLPASQCPSSVLTWCPPRASSLSDTRSSCRRGSLIWINSTTPLALGFVLLCFPPADDEYFFVAWCCGWGGAMNKCPLSQENRWMPASQKASSSEAQRPHTTQSGFSRLTHCSGGALAISWPLTLH